LLRPAISTRHDTLAAEPRVSQNCPWHIRTTIANFLKLRGKALEGGLVFRQFMDFDALSDTPPNTRPLIKEYRIFYLNTAPLTTIRYWNVPGYDPSHEPDTGQFQAIARAVRSRFFTMDVAQLSDGSWMIIDLGDAQIASIPTTANLDAVFHGLAGSV
jgi:hypothetical protein